MSLSMHTRSVAGTFLSVALALAVVAAAPAANAYQVNSSFSNPCHESISVSTYNGVLDDIDASEVPLPTSDVWRRLAKEIEKTLGVNYKTAQEELILVSLVIGTREPDTEGHSVATFRSTSWRRSTTCS